MYSRQVVSPSSVFVRIWMRNVSSRSSLVGRDFLSLKDFDRDDICKLLWTAQDLKHRIGQKQELYRPLQGTSMAMLFQKRSTRTRLSGETGMALLGGRAMFLGADDIHLGVNESVSDSARVLSGYCDLILARVSDHDTLLDLSNGGSIPVINGLSDMFHPLQILADFLTLQEHFGKLRRLNMAYIGDGNNIAHSYISACTRLDINLTVATPKGYEPNNALVTDAAEIAQQLQNTKKILYTHDPMEAAKNADVIITDTWVSMGQESEKTTRIKDFIGFQVNSKMINVTSRDSVFLHCLPRKGDEVTDEVFNSSRSLVWHAAHNRLWTVMSVLLHILREHTPNTPKPNVG